MRIELRWTSSLLALLVAACTDIPDPQPRMPPDGESTPPPEGGGDEPGDDDPGPDPSTPPVMPESCQVAGQTFPHGSAVPSGDSCNSCTCADGNVVCTDINCQPEACEAYLEVPDGACSRPADDPCIDQDPDCTEPEPEPEPEPEKLACDAGGQTFPHEAEVPSGDSCNVCSCDDGSVVCTESTCDPVFCAEFVEELDGVCARFPLDPCIAQDPDCDGSTVPVEPTEPTEP